MEKKYNIISHQQICDKEYMGIFFKSYQKSYYMEEYIK